MTRSRTTNSRVCETVNRCDGSSLVVRVSRLETCMSLHQRERGVHHTLPARYIPFGLLLSVFHKWHQRQYGQNYQ